MGFKRPLVQLQSLGPKKEYLSVLFFFTLFALELLVLLNTIIIHMTIIFRKVYFTP